MKNIIITTAITLFIIGLIIFLYQKRNAKSNPPEKKDANTAAPIYDIIYGIPSNQITRPGWSVRYPDIYVGIGNENKPIGWNIAGMPIVGGDPNMIS